MSETNRPLSPHLGVYKWQVTMMSSILHRATGCALSIGLVGLVAWLIAAAGDASAYSAFQALAGSFLGKLVMFGFTFAVFYHLGNGIRHLVWDIGFGYEKATAAASAWAVIAFAVVSTGLFWLVAGGAA